MKIIYPINIKHKMKKMDNDRWLPQYFKIEFKHYLVFSKRRNTRARSTRVKQYCHFDNFVLLTSSGLDGDYVPIPTWKYNCWQLHFSRYAGYLDKCRRQQNNEILIRHSPGIGECFFIFKYLINRKNKKVFFRGL